MWTYSQLGKLTTPEGNPSAHQWYSGYGSHADVPTDEGLLGLGPIPRGTYTMSGMLTNTNLGPVAIHLMPDVETLAYIKSLGRSPYSFYIHDDTVAHDHEASEGCLVSVSGSGPVLDIWNSTDHVLQVV